MKTKKFLFILIVLVLTACSAQTPVAMTMSVPAATVSVPATAIPVPETEALMPPHFPGKIVFLGVYDNPNTYLLDLVPGAVPSAIPLDGSTDKIVGQVDGKVIVSRRTGTIGKMTFFAYSPSTGTIEEIATPFEINIWDTSPAGTVVDWKKGPDGKLYFMFRKIDDKGTITVYDFRLEETKFIPVNTVAFKLQSDMSFQADAGQYTANLGKIIQPNLDSSQYFIFDTQSGKRQLLYLMGKKQFDVYFTPDEKSIVYSAYEGSDTSGDTRFCITTATLDMTYQEEIYCNNSESGYETNWSPDSNYIAILQWQTLSGKPASVQILDVKTQKVTRPVILGSYATIPVWSPDSKYVAFFSAKDNDPAFWTMRADGTEFSKLYSDPEFEKNWNKFNKPGGNDPYFINAWIK